MPNNTFSRALTAVKFFLQFGLRPLALYGLYKWGLFTGHYKRLTPAISISPTLNSFSLFALPNRDQFLQILGEDGKAALLKQADEIVSGKIMIFDESTLLDFRHGQSLVHWTAYERDHKLLSSFNFPHNDIKYLWEPARFGFAFILGRAYHLTQDDQYAEAFWKHFESFTQNNPANLGPHWMNGQEVAIRLMAFVWAYHVFESAPATSVERSAALRRSIHQHASRIPPTLEYARSQNNNHLVTEAAAIYTAGLFFKNAAWRKLGWQWFNLALQNQIGGYGEYIQHSTNYHRVMLQTALWVNFIKQDVFTASTSQALARSTHWLFSLVDNASGLVPNLGANDGALIFPLSVTSFDDHRPTVQAAARAFLRNSLTSGVWDEMSLWFGLKASTRVSDSDAYLTDNLRAKHSWGYLRTSNFKSRLSHIDQLHFDLWWRGLNIAQDAGTYLYNAESPWDNLLVTTRVHNTITVDHKDQMTRSGRFLVLDWAGAFAKPVIELDEKILHKIKAYHTGYRRLGIKHERMVTVFEDEFWRIEDRLLSPRRTEHIYRLHWLLIDGEWNLEHQNDRFILQIKIPAGIVKLVTSSSSPDTQQVSLVRAGEVIHGARDVKPYEGWVSRNYGEKHPALSFMLEVTSPYHTTFTSEFSFSK
jgi:hypothetical protein